MDTSLILFPFYYFRAKSARGIFYAKMWYNIYMHSDHSKNRQNLRVIISEIIMVIAVVLIVAILALIVSGYWVNSEFEVERQGMLQVSSVPTGAELLIDGESSWLQRTNASKTLSSGEHTITLEKEGYDSWTKTINISEGLLYRLSYPYLFLKNRTPKEVYNATGSLLASVSPDRETLLLMNDTTEWTLLNLKNNELSPKKIDVSAYFSSVSLAENASVGLFPAQILDADWDQNGRHLLLKAKHGENIEWVLLDVENPKNSINLTKGFGSNFEAIEILDDSADNLLAIQNHNLHKIDLKGKVISAILAENVYDFDHYEDEVIFSAKNPDQSYQVGLFKIGDKDIKTVTTLPEPTKVTISKFYDHKYLTTLTANHLSLYQKTDFQKIGDFELGFSPSALEVGHNGSFIVAYDGSKIATLDMEITKVLEWSVDGSSFGWLNDDMIYSVHDGELIVYDFDGLNRRVLAKNVSEHFPAMITENKWLYYFSDGDLIRENLEN